MPSTLTNARQYVSRRAQAERNVRTRIQRILAALSSDIVKAAKGITLVSSEPTFRQMVYARSKSDVDAAEEALNYYIREYSKASITILGDKDTGATGRLLNSELFGKTFEERSHTYMQYFFNDVVKMIIAGRKLKMKEADLEKTVQSQYRDPYTNGIIDQANRKGANIQVPSYGRGIYHSAYGNIVRNAQGTISIAWGREQKNYAKRNGAIGFIVFRGSSYPCAICDDEVDGGYIHPIGDAVPPYHVNCVCGVIYIDEQGQPII